MPKKHGYLTPKEKKKQRLDEAFDYTKVDKDGKKKKKQRKKKG
jgi:hypothetical protein